jgi:uracil-DNA glycosylase
MRKTVARSQGGVTDFSTGTARTIQTSSRAVLPPIPESWRPLLQNEVEQDYCRALDAFLTDEVKAGKALLPPRSEIFQALELTAYTDVKVLLLGQDPYPTPGDAHGLCFSVRPGVKVPRSLQNIYKELRDDVGFRAPNHGCLEAWARQGMLMLNTVLTLRAGEAFSHRGRGWEKFTDAVIGAVNAKPTRVVFVLWGKAAQAKRELITAPQHRIVECGHPSPLSARFFMGCRCFSKINAHLGEAGLAPMDWQLPDV